MAAEDWVAGDSDLDGRIAIVGMAGRFPGAADLTTFWSNLRDGVESIETLSEEELLAAGESLDVISDPAYVRAAAPLDDIDQFDAAFFGMSPRDAAVFDPQHRLFLECAWEAFEDAGYVGELIDGSVGVFAACGLSEYMFKNVLANEHVASSVGEWLVRHTGNDTNFLATRVSYELDLHGPSLNVQTACSSTLVAVHLACQSLLSGECDVALVGGAVVAPVQYRGYLYKEGEILSPDGHCRAFDARSAGTVISSACGAVVLKPLADALDDGDHVLAVVRGSAINNDGRAKVGYLAPSVPGQAQVVTEALAVADVDPRDVSYIEAHGTGTLIGDPIEVAGLTQAFRLGTDDVQFCAIGSLKSNIGHTGEASGIGALIKTVLSLQHREIPPSLHFEEPNPQADFPSSPFFVNAELRPWEPGPGGTRIAGITGLGAGGTNAHVIVEEAPRHEPSTRSRAAQLITVSARSADATRRAAAELAAHLRAHPDLDLADVSYTRLAGRKPFAMRRAIVATSTQDAADLLDAPTQPVDANHHRGDEPSVVFMLPGGGAQYAGMGRQLYDEEPAYRAVIDACAQALRATGGVDLLAALYPDGDVDEATRRLEAPSLALPALYATEVAMARLLESWGITPAAMIGHSAGEYAAACLSGVVSLEEGLALVALRGRLFATLPPGAMVSVPLAEPELRELLPAGLSIAAVNAPELCVASGPQALIEELEATLTARDIDSARIHIDVAAHSAMLEPILEEFGATCRRITFDAPTIPYVSNLTGSWITAADVTDPDYWVRHLRNEVRFRDGIDTILADTNRVLIEIGPGRTLASLARMAPARPAGMATTMRHPKEAGTDVGFALAAVGRAWEAGVRIDPAALFDGERRLRVALPTYPFEHQRFWVEPDVVGATRAAPKGVLRKRWSLDEWFSAPSWRRSVPSPLAEQSGTVPIVIINDGDPLAAALADRLTPARRVVPVVLGERFQRRADGGYEVNPARADDWSALVDALAADDALSATIVHMTAIGRSRGRRRFGLARDDELLAYRETVERDQASVLFLAQALSARAEPVRLALITSGVHALDSTDPLLPERALLHGAVRVVPRELGHVETLAIDVDSLTPRSTSAALVDAIVRELDAEWPTDVVVLRRGERWVRTLEPVPLPPAREVPWRPNGVHVITGGFGGIGLSIAEHIAKSSDSPTLVLVGRTALPPESTWDAALEASDTDPVTRRRIEAVVQLRTYGARVVVAAADVTDESAMATVVAHTRQRNGHITSVIHTAGILRDALIALRTPVAASAVVDVKARGALVLRKVLAADPPDLFVLFSSVSSIIGLPGQVDYTAANAFLDAYAAKANRDGRTRVVTVNWNAWQDVGMAVDAARAEREKSPLVGAHGPGGATQLFDAVEADGELVTSSTGFSSQRHWLLAEHAVRGGESLIPGTGYLELARAAASSGQSPGPVELTDVFFLSPFVVGDGEVRTLKVKLDRTTGAISMFSDTETSPHVTATVEPVDLEPAPARDLASVRARCTERVEHFDGYSQQPFMAFGPRWGSLRSIEYGDGEALVTTVMPPEFEAELHDLWLHPALMDVATGSAQALIPGFVPEDMFYVPFSYGRLRSRGPLPATAVSHVLLRSASGNELAVFDIVVCDEQGVVAVEIESFTMRRVSGSTALTSLRRTESPVAEPAGIESTVGAAMREGILPAEGVDALDRIVASGIAVQVIASSVDVEAWTAKVDAEAAASDDDLSDGGPQYERPNLSAEFEAPVTPIERELSAMWRSVLGIERVGRHDDFFELGGQSLIAVRLFTSMKKRYAIDLPLSTLFEAPTIAQSAAVVAAKLGVVDAADTDADAGTGADSIAGVVPPAPPAEETFRSLVTIQRGNENLVPFFCVHGSGGNVLNFRDLSQAMGRSQPFYGVQSRGIDGRSQPQRSIEEMATTYLTEIRELQPDGPYMLGGYSGGGLVAFEMAQQLTAAGEEIALLVMFDTFPPQVADRDITVAMRLQWLREERMGYLKGIVMRRVDARRDAEELRRAEAIAASGGVVPVELRDTYVQHAFVEAADSYTLRPWSGRIVLMRAAEVGFEAEGLGRAYGWDDVAQGGVEVVEVSGNHDTLVLESNASALVQQLRTTLDRTQAGRL